MWNYHKWVSLLLVASFCSIVVSGCWSRKELDELAIQVATAIDKVDNEYNIATQVVIPSEISHEVSNVNISPVTLFHATAPTMLEAFRKLTESSPRKIYSAHIRLIIISESLAREGIAEILDLFSRNPEARTDFYILVARDGTAIQTLQILTSLERIPAENLHQLMDISSKVWSIPTAITIEELIFQLVTEGTNPVISSLSIIGNIDFGKKISNVKEIDSSAILKIGDLAVFKGDKLVGWLNTEQSKGYNYIKNHVDSSVEHIECPDGGKIGIETLRNKTSIKARVINGEPVISIKIVNVGAVADVECKIDLDNPKTIKELEMKTAGRIETVIDGTIRHTQQKYNFDVLGFGHNVFQSNPQEWEKMKADWSVRYWPNLKINYDINVRIHKIGTTKNSFINNISS